MMVSSIQPGMREVRYEQPRSNNEPALIILLVLVIILLFRKAK